MSPQRPWRRPAPPATAAAFLFSAFAAWLGAAPLAPATAQEPAARAARVQVDAVRLERPDRTVPVIGRLVAVREGAVAARVDGPVAEVPVEVGDRVAAGAVLARLDGDRLRFERDLAAAELEAARSERRTAAAELDAVDGQRERLERLQGSAAFSRAGLEDKLLEAGVARAKIESAAALAARAEVNLAARTADLEDAAVLAPYGGVVVRRFVSPGAWLGEGDPVVALVDDAGLEVEADVPADRAEALEPGAVVPVRLREATAAAEAGAPPMTAAVRAVVPVENPLTRTRAVRFAPDAALRAAARTAGQSVTLDLPVAGIRPVLTVHKDAVTLLQGRRLVFVAAGGRAVERQVELGGAVGSRFEVVGGVGEGDLAIVRGNERLRDGQAVAVEGEAGPDGSAATAATDAGGGAVPARLGAPPS